MKAVPQSSALKVNNQKGLENPPVAEVGTKQIHRAAPLEGRPRTGAPLELTNLPDYPMGPGDVVEIIYQLITNPSEKPYVLATYDEIELSFLMAPQYNTTLRVRTDGNVSGIGIPDFRAAGMTMTQLEDALTSSYSTIMKSPVLRAKLVKSNAAVEELKKAITTSPRGQSRLEPIRPDGCISLPLIGDVKISGLTVPEASEAVRELYVEKGIEEVDITLVLLEVRSPIAYVTGDVVSPGPVVMQGPTDVWRLVGSAGGFSKTADRRHIIVARKRDGRESRFVIDYDRWVNCQDPSHNIMVARGDIVYVPYQSDRFIYVSGEVAKPGPVQVLPDQTITVAQAIASAGGVGDRGNECQVYILRSNFWCKPLIIPVAYSAIFDPGGGGAPDPPLRPGDIVHVTRTSIGDFNRFAKTWFKDGIWTVIPFNVSANYGLGGTNFAN